MRTALGLWRDRQPDPAAGAARLEEQRVTALEDCLHLELALGQHRQAISGLRALVAEHPLRERLARPS
ncbi:MAG TPA: BTAD domain-containing putative transcriptional regulator [Trebonia sp.]|nr:BTAD domain-containing putative transcriptional regulator [Trebonia sp.]